MPLTAFKQVQIQRLSYIWFRNGTLDQQNRRTLRALHRQLIKGSKSLLAYYHCQEACTRDGKQTTERHFEEFVLQLQPNAGYMRLYRDEPRKKDGLVALTGIEPVFED